MRPLLIAALALLPLTAAAQKSSGSAASAVAQPMPLRVTTELAGVIEVHDLHSLADGGAAALVRIADHVGIIWLDASWKETRRVEFRTVRSREMLRMAPTPDGGFIAAVDTRTATGLRVIDPQGRPQRLIPLASAATTLRALPGGDVLVTTFTLQADGSGVTQVQRLSREGTVRWQLRIPRAQVERLTVTADAFYVSAADPLAERSARVLRGSLDGRWLWERALPWDAAAAAAVERVLGRTRGEPTYARSGIVAASANGVVVFAQGGESFGRFLPQRYDLTLGGEVTRGPVVTPAREGWGAGREPYAGWAPTAYPSGAVANADGTFTLAMHYQDADGAGYVALARTRADGTTVKLWWAVSREALVETGAGWVLVQRGEGVRISLVEGTP